MLWMLRRHTPSAMTFWVCDDTNTGGVLGVKVDGGSEVTGDTLGAALNYTGTVTATGLSAGAHTYQLTLDGSDVTGATGTFRTAPAAGENATLMFVVCSLEAEPCFAQMVGRETADACYTSEFLYIDEGEYSSSPASAATIPNLRTTHDELATSSGMTSAAYLAFRDSYRLKHRYSYIRDGGVAKPWRHKFGQTFPLRMGWDNHEFETETTQPAPGSNQFDGAFQAAWEYYFQGNPVNADSPIDTGTTYHNGTTTVGFCPYFAEVMGDVEVIVPDMVIASADATTRRYDDAGRGVENQLDWIKARIAASTAKFLVIFNPQRIDTTNAEWTDGTTGLFKAINDKDQTIIVLTGDIHRPYARLIQSATYCPDRALLDVGVSPLRQTSNSDFIDIGGDAVYHDPLGTGSNIQTTYDSIYSAGGAAACNWTYCVIESRPNGGGPFAGSHVEISLRNPLTGADQWSAYIPEGSRTPVQLVAGTVN